MHLFNNYVTTIHCLQVRNEWMSEWSDEQRYLLKRVKTHDSNITEKPVALIYNTYKVINSTLKRLKAT
jgi:hypothetical protein